MAKLVLQKIGGGGGGGDGIRKRVNHWMHKLSDRDTEAVASSELDAIARSLDPEAFTPFICAISDARTADKSPLRRHPLRLLSLLSSHHEASVVLPHLRSMLSLAIRRLRDPDSSVRAACVEAVRSIAASHSTTIVSLLLPPLTDAILHEQDQRAQSAAALALAAAIDAATASDGGADDLPLHLQRLVPRLVKLLRSNAFKAKPSLISLLGSTAGAGGASTAAVLAGLVPCLADFLGCDDWAARKAAAEALARLALTERDLLGVFKSTCLPSFQSRKFDKVKIVRDSMNQMIEVWKDIPVAEVEENVDLFGRSSSSRGESGSHGGNRGTSFRPSLPSSSPGDSATKTLTIQSPPPESSPLTTLRTKSASQEAEEAEKPTPFPAACEESMKKKKTDAGGRVQEEEEEEEEGTEFVSHGEEKKSASHVAPLEGTTNPCINGVHGIQKGGADLSFLHFQLLQIEKQQNNLLDLLQRFARSSQRGISSLDYRVRVLEIVLDKMSRKIAASSPKFPSWYQWEVDTCCILPGS